MKKIQFLLLLVCSFSATAEVDKGWGTSISGGANLSTFDSANTSTGVGFYAGVVQKYFFHKNIGFAFGGQFMQRQLKFDASSDASGSGRYLDLPAALSFQYSSWGVGIGQVDVGAFYAVPISDYSIEGFTYDAKGYWGLLLNFTTAFPIDDSFYFGFNLGYKYAFNDSVTSPATTTTASTSAKNNDFMIGLVGLVTY